MSAAHNVSPTLFLIPDISGFTTFINKVEIDHSTHIITELLEILLSANILDLKVSEIEGDAVFFYRIGEEPSFEELIQQVEEMYTKFHQHLKFYERDRICQCGACSTTNELSLKFVSHYGVTTIRKIGVHKKLFGSDVTLTHKLLKNDIALDDYLLLTSPPKFSESFEKPDWLNVEEGVFQYSGIGEVSFNYTSLAPLKPKIAELPPRTQFHRYGKPVSATKTLHISLKKLHGIVTDFSLRSKWIFGLRLVETPDDNLNTVGSKHLCVLPANSMEFVITSQHIEDGVIEYVEQSDSIKWLAPLHVVFVMERISSDTSRITIQIHYKKNWLSKLYLDFPLRLMMVIMLKVSLGKLRRYIVRKPALKEKDIHVK